MRAMIFKGQGINRKTGKRIFFRIYSPLPRPLIESLQKNVEVIRVVHKPSGTVFVRSQYQKDKMLKVSQEDTMDLLVLDKATYLLVATTYLCSTINLVRNGNRHIRQRPLHDEYIRVSERSDNPR